jgi:hypothetical protein
MEPEGLFPFAEDSSTWLCLDPVYSNSHSICLRLVSVLSFHLVLGLPSSLSPSILTNIHYLHEVRVSLIAVTLKMEGARSSESLVS